VIGKSNSYIEALSLDFEASLVTNFRTPVLSYFRAEYIKKCQSKNRQKTFQQLFCFDFNKKLFRKTQKSLNEPARNRNQLFRVRLVKNLHQSSENTDDNSTIR